MPEYLLSATDESGRRLTKFLQADSGDGAVAAARERGWAEIVLHTDDTAAATADLTSLRRIYSPRDILRLQRATTAEFVFLIVRKGLSKIWWALLALLLLFVGWPKWAGEPWGIRDLVSVAAILGIPSLTYAAIFLFGSARRYQRLLRDVAWARWESVPRRLRTLKGLPPREFVFRKAQALAGLGKLDEALDEFRRLAEREEVPDWLYWSLMSNVSLAARDYDKAIESQEKAVRLGPGNPTLLLGLAGQLLVTSRRDTVKASALLTEAKGHALGDTLRFGVSRIEGILALEAGDPGVARKFLERSLEELGFAGNNALIDQFERVTHAYLCLARAALGDAAVAEEHFRRAEPMLRAHRADDLLECCRAALRS